MTTALNVQDHRGDLYTILSEDWLLFQKDIEILKKKVIAKESFKDLQEDFDERWSFFKRVKK